MLLDDAVDDVDFVDELFVVVLDDAVVVVDDVDGCDVGGEAVS